jgi:hypothetical protein
MADPTALIDVDHFWGDDLRVSPTGDLGQATRAVRSKERILRRLMTNLQDYLSHPTYGAGLPGRIGTLINIPEIVALIRGQMFLEDSVARSPEPTINAVEIVGGVSVSVTYTIDPDRQPVALSFSVSA